MWNKAAVLSCRIHVAKTGRKTVSLWIPVPLYVLRGLILSFDGILALIPGAAGRRVRAAMDTLYQILSVLTDEPDEDLVHVDVREKESDVFVRIRTISFFGNGKQGGET